MPANLGSLNGRYEYTEVWSGSVVFMSVDAKACRFASYTNSLRSGSETATGILKLVINYPRTETIRVPP